jgi:Sec-independent protein secretion pathway component TatC
MVDTPMPLTAHRAELRSRLIWCMVALAVGLTLILDSRVLYLLGRVLALDVMVFAQFLTLCSA